MNKGKVIQVLSSVVDVEFKNSLPAINNALIIKIDKENNEVKLKGVKFEVQDKDGNWFLHSGNVFMDVIKSGHKPFVQEGYPTDMMGIIYDEIEKGSRVVVNLAPREERIGAHVYSIDDGHSIGIQSVSKMQKTNIWGNTSSYYSVRVMDPGMNGNNGGYKYISPDYIKSSQNMSIFYRIR